VELLWAIIAWTVFGLICGAIARLIVPGRQAMGVGMTILLGIVGSLVGGFIGYLIAGGEPFHGAGWILSIVGAVLVLWLYVAAAGRRRPV
jgi:uncharacterized membrane protein YeaQ/YmgE (transglycosylase-associated protein family)